VGGASEELCAEAPGVGSNRFDSCSTPAGGRAIGRVPSKPWTAFLQHISLGGLIIAPWFLVDDAMIAVEMNVASRAGANGSAAELSKTRLVMANVDPAQVDGDRFLFVKLRQTHTRSREAMSSSALSRPSSTMVSPRCRRASGGVRWNQSWNQFSLKTWPVACYPSTARLRESTRTWLRAAATLVDQYRKLTCGLPPPFDPAAHLWQHATSTTSPTAA
jgi:hypothetical protein